MTENKADTKQIDKIGSVEQALQVIENSINFHNIKTCANNTCGVCSACAIQVIKNHLAAGITSEDKRKFKRALAANGEHYYAGAVQEEAAELITAINHIRRRRNNAKEKAIREMAQLQIMLEIFKIAIFPVNQENKLFRKIFEEELDIVVHGAENNIIHVERD